MGFGEKFKIACCSSIITIIMIPILLIGSCIIYYNMPTDYQFEGDVTEIENIYIVLVNDNVSDGLSYHTIANIEETNVFIDELRSIKCCKGTRLPPVFPIVDEKGIMILYKDGEDDVLLPDCGSFTLGTLNGRETLLTKDFLFDDTGLTELIDKYVNG